VTRGQGPRKLSAPWAAASSPRLAGGLDRCRARRPPAAALRLVRCGSHRLPSLRPWPALLRALLPSAGPAGHPTRCRAALPRQPARPAQRRPAPAAPPSPAPGGS